MLFIFTSPNSGVKRVDSSGAGDAWCAGFIAGITRGYEIRKAVELGSGVGSLCVTEVGTTSGLKSMEYTHDFIERSGM